MATSKGDMREFLRQHKVLAVYTAVATCAELLLFLFKEVAG